MTKVLLKNILRIYTANFRRKRFVKKGKILATLVGLLFLPFLIVVQTGGMFKMWLFLPGGYEFLHRFVSASQLGVLFLLFLTGLPIAMHHFFLAEDLSMLRVFPLPAEQIYAQKFLEAAIGNLGMFFVIGFPVLLSMTMAIGFSPPALLVIIIASLFFIFIPTGLSVLVSLLLAQFFSVKKVRRFATLLLGMFIVLAWAGFQFLRLSRLDPLSIDFDPMALQTLTRTAERFDLVFSPSDWLVNSVLATVEKSWAAMALYLILLFVLSVAMFVASVRWRVALDKRDIRINAQGRSGASGMLPFQSQTLRFYAALLLKDFRLLFRDTRFFQNVFIVMAMLIISPFLSDGVAAQYPGTLDVLTPYIPLTILVLIVSSAMGRQNLPMERLSFQYIKLAPLRMREILIVKSMRNASLVIAALTAAVIVSAWRFHTPGGWLLFVLGVNWLLAVAGSSLGQTFGAIAGRFDWTDPRYMVDMSWTVISMLAHLAFGAVGIGILTAGWHLQQLAVAFVLFFVYVCLVFELSTRIAQKHLEKLDWTF